MELTRTDVVVYGLCLIAMIVVIGSAAIWTHETIKVTVEDKIGAHDSGHSVPVVLVNETYGSFYFHNAYLVPNTETYLLLKENKTYTVNVARWVGINIFQFDGGRVSYQNLDSIVES